jgi:hypothetical protein
MFFKALNTIQVKTGANACLSSMQFVKVQSDNSDPDLHVFFFFDSFSSDDFSRPTSKHVSPGRNKRDSLLVITILYTSFA